jgi:hypothetical protein
LYINGLTFFIPHIFPPILINCYLTLSLNKVAEKNPQKALELLLKLSEFTLPKLRAIEVNNEPEGKLTSLNINIIDTGVPFASCEADIRSVSS